MAWGDVDRDGRDDLFVGGAAGQPATLLIHQGGKGFARQPISGFLTDQAAEDMGAVFFDADGDRDLDLYVVSGGVECEPGAVVLRDRLYLNDGQGRFIKAPAGALPDVRDSGSVVVACDFDADGDVDLFVGGRVIPGQ